MKSEECCLVSLAYGTPANPEIKMLTISPSFAGLKFTLPQKDDQLVLTVDVLEGIVAWARSKGYE